MPNERPDEPSRPSVPQPTPGSPGAATDTGTPGVALINTPADATAPRGLPSPSQGLPATPAEAKPGTPAKPAKPAAPAGPTPVGATPGTPAAPSLWPALTPAKPAVPAAAAAPKQGPAPGSLAPPPLTPAHVPPASSPTLTAPAAAADKGPSSPNTPGGGTPPPSLDAIVAAEPPGPRQAPKPEVDSGARGRHVTGAEHAWGWVAGWTLLGTALPGSGMIAAGYRRLGGLVLGVSLLLPLVLGVVLWRRGAVQSAVSFGTDPEYVLVAVGALVAVALAVGLVMLATNALLMRRTSPGDAAKVANAFLVAVLILAIGAPAAVASRYLLITRSTISNVFGDDFSGATRPDGDSQNPWAGIPRVNVLLVGSDAEDDRPGTRTDSMIVASVNTRTGDMVMLSPPRNLQRVPFPRGSVERRAWPNGFGNTTGAPWPKGREACGETCFLSAVWNWAEENKEQYYPDDPHPGVSALRSGIEGAFGIDIDAYVVVNIQGFKDVVDALGGLTLDVHQRLPIGGSVEVPVAKEWIEPGLNQRMDGYHAMWFARSRWSTTDFDRMARQRCTIAALTDQADPVSLVRAYPDLAETAGRNITTDVPANDLAAWVELAQKVKTGDQTSLTFTSELIGYAHPDFAKMRRLVDKAIEDSGAPAPTPTAASGTVPGATPSATPTRGADPKPSATPTPDPAEAQNTDDVC